MARAPANAFFPGLAAAGCLLAALLAAASPRAEDGPAYGAMLEGFDYPYKVERFSFSSQGASLVMAFMDVAPEGAGEGEGRTALLLHGKNFCAATWEETIAVLARAGYRVIAPDQAGFCKSSKPEGYQFSLHQLAANTKALLEERGVERATVIGHSMGGMLAARFALSYPEATERLALVNPIGLEDWKAEGVPYADIDALYEGERRTDYESIRAYQEKFYYDGAWAPRYERWARMLAGLYAGPGAARVAWNQAQASEMIYTQPVIHEFANIAAPTLLFIGERDRTAPGAGRAPAEVAARLGNYPELGRRAAAAIPDARLIAFPDLGHSPQVEAPDRFHAALLDALGRGPGEDSGD